MSFKEDGEELFLDQTDRREGVVLLGRMSAVESNDRNLEAEDADAKQDIELHQRDLWGDDQVEKTKPDEDEPMRIMAARDVHYSEGSLIIRRRQAVRPESASAASITASISVCRNTSSPLMRSSMYCR